MKRNPEIVLRKGEKRSYGKLMRFNKETVKHFFELLSSIFEETKFLPHQIYNVDETGVQLIFSGKDKVLAEKGSKRVHMATHGEQGEIITVIAAVMLLATGILQWCSTKEFTRRRNLEMDCQQEASST